MSEGSAHHDLRALSATLRRFGAFRKRWSCLEGGGRFLLLGPGALLAWFLSDWAIGLPGWLLLPSFAVICGVCLWAMLWHGLRPCLRRTRLDHEALAIESLHGGLDNLVIGALELSMELESSESAGRRLGHSPLLVRALASLTVARLGTLDLRGLVDLTRARRVAIGGGCVALVVAACLALAPGAVRDRMTRLGGAYASLLDALFPVTFQVEPGNRAVVRGRPVTLEIRVTGARRERVTLLRTPEGGNAPVATPLSLEKERASFRVPAVDRTFVYEFDYGGRRTGLFTITAGDLPEISAINYELAPPAYTGRSPRTITGRAPRLEGLGGTTVLVSFASTMPLHPDLSYIEWQNGPRQPVAVSGRFGHFSFVIEKPDRATIHLTGHLGPEFKIARPVGLEVAVQRDSPPTIRIRAGKRKLTMLAEQAATFGFEYVAEDDFGVAETALAYRIDTIDEMLGRPARDAAVERRVEPPRERVGGRFEDLFKALSPPLRPGDRITITMTARDNNTETGPGLGRSRPLEIVIVAPDLGVFTDRSMSFGEHALLGGLKRVRRQTNLLIAPEKSVRTEATSRIEKKTLKARVGSEGWPCGSEDAVGQYFQILSGGN